MRCLRPSGLTWVATLVLSCHASTQVISFGSGFDPDTAYNATIDRYLVAWENAAPVFPRITTVMLRPGGAFTGTRGSIPSGTAFLSASQPRVAAVEIGQTKFVVVSIGGATLAGYTLVSTISNNGQVLSTTNLAGFMDDHSAADVGGEATAADDDVIVVFHNATQNKIQAAEFSPNTMATLQQIDLDSGPGLGSPSISSNGGQSGRYLITWERTTGVNTDIWGAIVDRDLQVLASRFPIAQTSADEDDPDVDGDGTNWFVAYESEITENSGDNDIVCRGVTYDPGAGVAYLSPAARVIQATPEVEERDPVVNRSGESYSVGYAFQFGGADYDLILKSLESFQCMPCEGDFSWATSGNFEGNMRIATGPAADIKLTVWHQSSATSTLVMGKRYRDDDGSIRDLGGACGTGGTAEATCSAVGAPAFGMRVQHAAPGATTWLVLGLFPVAFNCGSCTLVPNPVTVVPLVTDSHGDAQVAIQLSPNPSQKGLKLLSQWLVAGPGGCSSLGLSFSNAIEIEIE